jgi:hypothetical protein
MLASSVMTKSPKDAVDLRVKDLTQTNVWTIWPDLHLLRGAALVIEHRFRRIIPAADGDGLWGC